MVHETSKGYVVGEARIKREGMVSGNAPSEKGGGAGRSDEATNGSQDLSESVHLSSEVCKRAVVDKDHGSREVDESRQNTEHGRAENNAPSHLRGIAEGTTTQMGVVLKSEMIGYKKSMIE